MDEPTRIYVRSTVHLQGLPVGRYVLVDPSAPYIAELLEARFLVPLPVLRDGSVQESPDAPDVGTAHAPPDDG